MTETKKRPLPIWRATAALYLIVAALLAMCTDARAQVAPTCWPKQVGGAGTPAFVRSSAAGMAVAWGCPSPRTVAFFGGAWSQFGAGWQQLAAEIVAGGPAAMAQAWTRYVTVAWPRNEQGQIIPPPEIHDIVYAAFVAAQAALPPADLSAYVVTASASGTRPAYPVINGKRSTLAAGAAVAGQPCDCNALQIIEFNVARYCASASITGVSGPAVTACSARQTK